MPGIDFLESKGIAAGAVAHVSAMIGEGMDAWENGVISVLNAPAEAMGFRLGEVLQAAACRVADAGLPEVVFTEAPRHADLRKVPVDGYGERIVLMDSISMIREADSGAAVVSSSHGGAGVGRIRIDASAPGRFPSTTGGIGRNEAGVASLALLDAEGIACGAVGHESARIGDLHRPFRKRRADPRQRRGQGHGIPRRRPPEAGIRAGVSAIAPRRA